MTRLMNVIDYCPDWPVEYEKETAALRKALGEILVRVHHIGSTAVPGLAAKPVIDMLLEVTDLDALDALNASMRSLGYEPRGEFGIPGRRYFPKGGDARTHHVHAFAAGATQVLEHLAFRDYLRSHPKEIEAYGAVKRAASEAHRTDPKGYVAYKSAHVSALLNRALEWKQQQIER